MDRRSIMVSKPFALPAMIGLIILTCSCNSPQTKQQELTGKWVDKQKGELVFRNDGSFTGTALLKAGMIKDVFTLKFGESDTATSTSNYRGTWEISCDEDPCGVVLNINEENDRKVKEYSAGFYIQREGIFSKGKIYQLQRYLDSDGVYTYNFSRP